MKNQISLSKPVMYLVKGMPFSFHFYFVIGLLSISLLSSCGNAKSAIYFENASQVSFPSGNDDLEPIIQKNDLLSITVSSVNVEAAELFNQQNDAAAKMSTNSGGTSKVSGYLVGQDGLLRFPILGNIQAAGKSKREVRDLITSLLIERQLLIEPIVDIRYLNYKISILGEVKNPSVLTIDNERISILEALGLVGDITIYGRRDNVSLIREEDGLKIIHKLDLTTNQIFESPYYYLQSNDIVYVQPNKGKIAGASELKQWIPVILSAISLAVVTIVTVTR
jgi:polysaccharide export outer membrane protein